MLKDKNIKDIIYILTIIIIILYFITDENTKIFNKQVWPIKKENRLKELIVFNPYNKNKDNTIIDPYSLTHFSHGIIFYYIVNYNKYDGNNYIYALLLEIIWELIENMPYIINLYREKDKYSGNYRGDSIVNIISDIIFMSLGYYASINNKYAYIYVIIIEIFLYFAIKDNLIITLKTLFF